MFVKQLAAGVYLVSESVWVKPLNWLAHLLLVQKNAIIQPRLINIQLYSNPRQFGRQKLENCLTFHS